VGLTNSISAAEATGLRWKDDGGGVNDLVPSDLDIDREKIWLQVLNPPPPEETDFGKRTIGVGLTVLDGSAQSMAEALETQAVNPPRLM
jgi:hypothetical protein